MEREAAAKTGSERLAAYRHLTRTSGLSGSSDFAAISRQQIHVRFGVIDERSRTSEMRRKVAVAKLPKSHRSVQPKLVLGSRAPERSLSAMRGGEPAARMNAIKCSGGTSCWCA